MNERGGSSSLPAGSFASALPGVRTQKRGQLLLLLSGELDLSWGFFLPFLAPTTSTRSWVFFSEIRGLLSALPFSRRGGMRTQTEILIEREVIWWVYSLQNCLHLDDLIKWGISSRRERNPPRPELEWSLRLKEWNSPWKDKATAFTLNQAGILVLEPSNFYRSMQMIPKYYWFLRLFYCY